MEDALALSRRREIHGYIAKYPGAHFRDIQEKLGVPTGVLQHHLKVLEKLELVSFQMEGARKRYFVKSAVPFADRALLAIVRLKKNRDILMRILVKRRTRYRELLVHFNMKKSTLSFHVKKLVETGLVVEGRDEREKAYSIADPDALARILITYRESFLDEAVDRFVDLWTRL
jgi:predicted transcriptional regulator